MEFSKLFRNEQDYVYELWNQLAHPKLSETGSATEALYQIYQSGVEYRMDNQILFTNQEAELYRLLYTFLDIAEDIIQRVPMDLMEVAKYEHNKRARQELQNKINEAWKTLGNLRKWNSMLGGLWMDVLQKMSLNPEYANVTWGDLQDKGYMNKVYEKFIVPVIKKRSILIVNISRHTEKLLKMVRDIYNKLLDLDYIGPNKTRLQTGFQNLIDQTERYFQASMKHIKKIQEDAKNRQVQIANILYQTLSDQHMEREIAGLGKMPLYNMDTPDGIILVRNYKNWMPMLHDMSWNMNWLAIHISLMDLMSINNEYLVPLTFIERMGNPSFFTITINFLSFMIINYLALKNSYNVDLTVYTSTKQQKTVGVGADKAIRDYVLDGEVYGKIIDEFSVYLKKPVSKSLNKLLQAMTVVDEQNQQSGIIMCQTPEGARLWYNNNRVIIDPLLIVPRWGPNQVFTTAKLIRNLIQNIQLGADSLMAKYRPANKENLPSIKRAVQQGPGTVIHSILPLLSVLSPDDIKSVGPEHMDECCIYEIKVPAGTKGILFNAGEFVFAPCSEFVVQRYDNKNKTAKLVYKGSKMKNISKEVFEEMMRDYNKMHGLKFRKEEQTVEEFEQAIREFQEELYLKYRGLIEDFIQRCRGQVGGGRKQRKDRY